ncbi:TonB-dependent siderophore receptor [Rhizobacter sp. LjRoot28]|uniref:TonB-dependent siderophore receptor n=1 Tax=Rhizobacter sp. LjRoot28 TaxID=3342309 RepID=UPI003ECF05C7
MNPKIRMTACALAACALVSELHAQETVMEPVVVKAKRENRVSKGATGLPMEIKETPQTISTIEKEDIRDFGATSSNDALRLGTGINIEQFETNRVTVNSRGFDIMLTQMDGLGMTNDWGVLAGQQDTVLFERVELIRGANGLLTGVGNSSGTINYVRKRPTNKDGGEATLTKGSHDKRRVTLDYNKILTDDGKWAGRFIVAHEDADSYLRALHDTKNTVYGVIDGQIGDNGVLTLGFTHQKSKQRSAMWGSMTLNRTDGTQADFDRSSSTAQDWTYWNTSSESAFVEYTHALSPSWEAKVTFNTRQVDEETKLLYAYSLKGALEPDNTGLTAQPYRSSGESTNHILDANLSGEFEAFGRTHSLLVGASHSRQEFSTDTYSWNPTIYQGLVPVFPYPGNTFPEPVWGPMTPDRAGKQQMTRMYGSTRISLTDRLKGIFGFNAIHLKRSGDSALGATGKVDQAATNKVSPYVGATYDFTPNVLGYVSYSDIFQSQDQIDATGTYLRPMKGLNIEAGAKADWFDKNLLTTFAVFGSKQKGLATFASYGPNNTSIYEAKDVKSEGIELEATGRLTNDSRVTVGLTKLRLKGPDGNDIYEWVPRTTANFHYATRMPFLTDLRAGIGGRWQSDVRKNGGAKQDSYFLAHAFASYAVTDNATLRLNVNNLFDKKYVGGLSAGAIYGAPRNAALTLEYKL